MTPMNSEDAKTRSQKESLPMNPHIEATITELRARISKLETVITLLLEFGSDNGSPPSPLRRFAVNPVSGNKDDGQDARPTTPRARRAPAANIPAPKPTAKLKLKDVMREIISGLNVPFSTIELSDMVCKQHPEYSDRRSSIGVNLIDMANKGELDRAGAGRNARYTVIKLKTSVASEYEKFRSTITVPTTE
jgi:hypothetical protein